MASHARDVDQSSDAPPAKRQKTQSKFIRAIPPHNSKLSDAANEDEVQKCSDFWFSSGNLVLVASGKLAFRVQGDVLGRKSRVFNDMLALEASRPVSEETMEGCPVVHLTDSSDDFKAFLSFIYDGFE